jgi:hypothetical protein
MVGITAIDRTRTRAMMRCLLGAGTSYFGWRKRYSFGASKRLSRSSAERSGADEFAVAAARAAEGSADPRPLRAPINPDPQNRNPRSGAGDFFLLSVSVSVGAGRFELPTSRTRTERATKLRYAPKRRRRTMV